jgi:hypothetical protein
LAEKLTVPDAGPLPETTLASNVTLCDVATLIDDEVSEVVVGLATDAGVKGVTAFECGDWDPVPFTLEAATVNV